MKKVILGSLLSIGIVNAMYFDNSIGRWEGDCIMKGAIGASNCMIAARMYERGSWEDAQTGKFIKIKGTRKKHNKRAIELFQIACDRGDKKGCEKLIHTQ